MSVLLLLLVQDLGALLDDLRSERLEVREKAALELRLRGDSAVPGLKALAAAGDIEAAARARDVLGGIEKLRAVTDGLEAAFPGARRRLAGGDRAWTEIFLEATRQKGTLRAHPQIARSDVRGLAGPALRGARPDERARVLTAMAAWRVDPPAAELRALLDVDDWAVRQPLFAAIEACQARELCPDLRARSRRDASSKEQWLGLMVHLGCREAIPDLEAALAGSPDHRYGQGAQQLARLDAVEVIPTLRKMLRSGSHEALYALRLLAPEEVAPALEEAVEDPRPGVPAAVLRMTVLYHKHPETLPLLRRKAASADPAQRALAVQGLGAQAASDVLPLLLAALDDEAVNVRRAAALELARRGRRDGTAELRFMMERPELRGAAASALAALEGEGTRRWTPEDRALALKELKGEDERARSTAAWKLIQIDGPAALPLVRPLLEDEDTNVRWQVFHHLLDLGPNHVLDVVRKWSADPDRSTRSQALRALARWRMSEALPLLLRELESDDEHARWQGVDALSGLEVDGLLPRLRALLTDPSALVRQAAALALARRGERDGLGLLLTGDLHAYQMGAFNALRVPELAALGRGRKLSGAPLPGFGRPLLEAFAARAGLALEGESGEPVPEYGEPVVVDGQELGSVFQRIGPWLPPCVLEKDRLRVLSEREARIFWRRWGAEALADVEPDLSRRLLEELAASERRKAERRPPPPPAAPAAVELTPALKAVPGLEAKLKAGPDEVWTKTFVDAHHVYAHQEYRGLSDADFEALAPRALAGALRAEQRQQALQVVAVRGLKSARPLVEPYLKDPTGAVRVEAASALLKLDGAKALPLVLPLLGDEDATVRTGLTSAFGRHHVREAVPALLARREDPAIRWGLVAAAPDLEIAEALPILIEAARRPPGMDNYSARISAAFAIRGLGGPAQNADIRVLLREEDHPNAVQALIGCASVWGNRAAIPELLVLAERPKQFPDMVVPYALQALATLGAKEAAPLIRARLEKGPLHHAAIRAAAELGLSEAIPSLRKLLPTHPEAALALGRLGDRESIAALRTRLDSKDYQVPGPAASGLAWLGDRASYPRLIEMRAELGLIRTRESALALAAGTGHIDPRGLTLLEAFDGPDVFSALRGRLTHSDAYTRQAALRALGRLSGEAGLAELRKGMSDASPDGRYEAASALCRRGSAEGLALAVESMERRYYELPFELNALRSPETWLRLKKTRITAPARGTLRSLVEDVARRAGLRVEVRPDDPWAPAWDAPHAAFAAAELPIDGLDAIERLDSDAWSAILEGDRILLRGRPEARAFWRAWAKERTK